jgi:hypothetical protein
MPDISAAAYSKLDELEIVKRIFIQEQQIIDIAALTVPQKTGWSEETVTEGVYGSCTAKGLSSTSLVQS